MHSNTPDLPTAPPTVHLGRHSEQLSLQGLCQLFHAYVKSWSFKILFQVLLNTETKKMHIFYAIGVFKKWLYFWLNDKHRGLEKSELLFALSGVECSDLPACLPACGYLY